jgi:hypothetical protein
LKKQLSPGYYRVETVSRNAERNRRSPFRIIARLGSPTWKAKWSFSFLSKNWEPEVQYFSLDEKGGTPALFMLTSPGTVCDIVSLKVCTVTLEEYRRSIVPNLPSASQAHYIRHTRFPLGLPSGWNTDLQGVFIETGAGVAPDGHATFKFISERGESSFYSEPFLTSAADGVATVRLHYRAKGEWTARAIADWGYRAIGGKKLVADDSWQEAEFTIKGPRDATALAVRFIGRG